MFYLGLRRGLVDMRLAVIPRTAPMGVALVTKEVRIPLDEGTW